MKRIKLRAWHIAEKKVCRVDTLTDTGAFLVGVKKGEDTYGSKYYIPAPEHGRFCDNEEFHLLQFTGLLDKNGVDIYEGDILKLSDEYRGKGEIPAYVIWHNSQWMMQGTMHYSHKDFIGNYSLENMDIIGNIYENPELL